MAKKPDKKKPSKGKAGKSWIDRLATPSRRQFNQYIRGQQTQYDPLIARLQMQVAGSAPEKDPVVQAYERLSASLPTEAAVSQAYGTGLQNLAGFMKDVNVARGGQAVQDIVQAVGGAVGAEAGTTADVAGTAGAVSGVGGGQDILSQALLESAGARFKGLETERLGEIAGQRQEFALGAGQARLSAKERQRELARLMAEAKGKKAAGVINPFDIASMVMKYQKNLKALQGYGSGGTGTGAASADDTVTGGFDPAEAAYRQQVIGAGLQGLITPAGMRPSAPGTITESGAMVGSDYTPNAIVRGPMAGTGYRAPVGDVTSGATTPRPNRSFGPGPLATRPKPPKRRKPGRPGGPGAGASR